MELTTPLLAKAIGGLAVASTVATVGIIKKDSIATALGLKSNKQQNTEITDIKSEVNKQLIEHLKTEGKDIVFKAYSGEEGETEIGSSFPSFNDQNQITIRFAISTKTTSSLSEDTSKTKENQIKKLLGTAGDLIWECKIKFNKNGSAANWKTEEKDIFYKNGSGFYQKITTSGNKLFKERFINTCGSLTSDHQPGNPIKLEKTFNLNTSDSNLTIAESDKGDFKSWFGEMELTEKETNAIKDTWNFSLENSSNTLILADIGTGNEKIEGCKVTMSGSGISAKTNNVSSALTSKFNETNQISKEKYREGFLKKCRNNENALTLNIDTDSDLNTKIKDLFDFSREESKQIYQNLKDVEEWSVASAIKENKKTEITITSTITKDSQTYTCKIIGTKANINTQHLSDSKDDLNKEIEDKVKAKTNNETNRANLLKKCGKAFNEEIEEQLKDKETNKYTFNDLNKIFA